MSGPLSREQRQSVRELNLRANGTYLSYNEKGLYFSKQPGNKESIQGKEGTNWKK
ncbi:hypothetical protein SAMN05216375_11532 [Trichococcus ilyis]|jgi:hypothetical protein|uniref:Uncharacterized protein n=1 Tax=Trichococcus ilyis TaxID=640938 RepID=A0A143Z4F3_9LACT|nr:Hypothetical protein TR210_2238 [Trichococcus ilyis]SEJ48982.1 hypothetical protein SAMN05216375_11532 [Trichococcus ilyis]